MEEQIKELATFLAVDSRLDLKSIALENVLALTGNSDGLKIIANTQEILSSLVALLQDKNVPIAREAALVLVNISSDKDGAIALINLNEKCDTTTTTFQQNKTVISELLKIILNPDSFIADACCMILSNLTRPSYCVDTVTTSIENAGVTFDELINVFTKNKYNSKGANLHYLGPVLSNLSQSANVRKYILDKEKCVIQRLLPFTEYKNSVIRRGGIIGTLRNCCFEVDDQGWLLSDKVDILPRLLLPLAGNTEYDDEDNDKLPLELQYLPDDKMREDDPDIRCMLLESLMQLCSRRENRIFVREKNTYVILRELHKWEKDKKALLACENLVDILIRTEEEIGEDNLRNLSVPEDLCEKFNKMDKEFLDDS